jgi:malectin (di-glucose binding ER protein)
VAAPTQVYQTAHQGSPVTFTLPGFVANSTGHTVVLHFAELYFSAAMQRVFNIQVGTVAGGMQVISDFDIYAAASAYLPAGMNAKDTAVVETYSNITADQNGNITVIFTGGNSGNVDQPMINGIEAR